MDTINGEQDDMGSTEPTPEEVLKGLEGAGVTKHWTSAFTEQQFFLIKTAQQGGVVPKSEQTTLDYAHITAQMAEMLEKQEEAIGRLRSTMHIAQRGY